MPPLLASYVLIAPAALAAAALIAVADPGSRPRHALLAARLATFWAFLTALAAAVLVVRHGPVTSPVLGFGEVGLSVRLDALSCLMFMLVSFVGVIVVRFSHNYLEGDPRQGAFVGGLCLTLASVSLLVLAGNLFHLVLAWMATSLALHRLLVFYRERSAAILAARKKFVTARLGDLCLIGAALLLARAFGTIDIASMLARARELGPGAVPPGVPWATLLVAVAALLKSAQFPAHGWLPEVMETPTPVSALLHAGIINAGGFLVVRLADVMLLSAPSLYLLAVVGGFTALFGGVVMLTQPSIKVSLAWSTVAQMGFMLLECGLGAFPLAVLHIIAHSFYKAHAFLSSGSVVDIARSAWIPDLKVRPHAGHVLASLALALLLYAGIGGVFGAFAGDSVAVLSLGAIMTMGLTLLIAQSLQGGTERAVVFRTVAAAGGATIAYFALQAGAAWLLTPTVPAMARPGPAGLIIMLLAVISFALVTVLQILAPVLARGPAWRTARVHLANGLYANVLFNRLVGAPQQITRTPGRMPAVPMDSGARGSTGARSGKPPSAPTRAHGHTQGLLEAARQAGRRIAPLWPLKHFVAVNPFLGVSELDFVEAAGVMARTAGAHMTMPRSFYAGAIADGRIGDDDLAAALARAGSESSGLADVAALKAAAQAEVRPEPEPLPTVADVVGTVSGRDWGAFVTERISAWVAGYFDAGQSAWGSPWRDLPPYEAWRREAVIDRVPEVMGVTGFRQTVQGLPDTAEAALAACVPRLGLEAVDLVTWFHRLLMSVGGWSSYARYRVWQSELHGSTDSTLVEFLAIRLAWEVAMLECHADKPAVAAAWARACEAMASVPGPRHDAAPGVDILLQSAYEHAWQRTFLAQLAQGTMGSKPARRAVQAAFCIDVRSEVFRRALESEADDVETIGFAGFFGFPIEYVPLGQDQGGAQCPVLLKPQYTVCEVVKGADQATQSGILNLRVTRRRVGKAWKVFKMAAVSSFGFVETMGWTYAGKLATDAFGLTRTVPHPAADGIDAATQRRLAPDLAPGWVAGRAIGFTDAAKLDLAESVLKAMSLRQGFARLVMLAGHGSTTVNNPHATGLDCGACGGHTGEANARVAAAILNDRSVREGLVGRGIAIDTDTVFIGALHDTTTDEVTIFDEDTVPASHARELASLKHALVAAGRRARAERAPRLHIGAGDSVDVRIFARSRDWSQVRPEWGLAGCAAFIAAPRERTRNLDLAGRAFLHTYDWRQDENFAILEQVMTAPMVVASWISLQYYGSTVDNRIFGSGNKVLHNVVGTLGVIEGNGGDLRVGLPWQSVHDGERPVHEPLRLSVVIEAPTEAIDAVIDRHENVRALVENGWLHLFALSGDPVVIERRAGRRQWTKA